jgi:glycosyltransferase involved in cell wall biosynthesis
MIERKRFIDIIQILKNLPEDVIFYLKQSVCTSDDFFPSALENLHKEIKKLRLQNRVIINPEIIPYEKMHIIYSAADVAIFPFLYEPFGMCAAEAMAAQRPLIVYNSGFLPTFINGNGFIIEPMNLEELENKTRLLLNDSHLATEMGLKGPNLVKQFDIRIVGEKLLDLYKEYIV